MFRRRVPGGRVRTLPRRGAGRSPEGRQERRYPHRRGAGGGPRPARKLQRHLPHGGERGCGVITSLLANTKLYEYVYE